MKHTYLNHEQRLELIVPINDRQYLKNRYQALEIINEYFSHMPDFATHHVWEEDGQKYSSWSFGNGVTSKIHTDDGGAIMMMNSIIEAGARLL